MTYVIRCYGWDFHREPACQLGYMTKDAKVTNAFDPKWTATFDNEADAWVFLINSGEYAPCTAMNGALPFVEEQENTKP